MGDCYIVRRGGGTGANVEKETGFPEFIYTGTYQLLDDGITADGVQNWRLKLLTSGTLTFSQLGSGLGGIDVFLLGGGGGGSNGGGGGGYTKTIKSLHVETTTENQIIIGAGGATGATDGGNTSAFGNVVSGGKKPHPAANTHLNGGGDGGSGGGSWGSKNGGSDGDDGDVNDVDPIGQGQGTTTREFGEDTGELYAGGGGGGTEGKGGAGGGMDAGCGGAAMPNTGGGGGGCDNSYYNSSKGGSGIVIIRNKRG